MRFNTGLGFLLFFLHVFYLFSIVYVFDFFFFCMNFSSASEVKLFLMDEVVAQ